MSYPARGPIAEPGIDGKAIRANRRHYGAWHRDGLSEAAR